MTCYIVTEGENEVHLLQAVLDPELGRADGSIRFAAGGGWSGAESLARSLLVVRHQPVALVVDADTVNPDRVREHRQFLEESLGGAAPRGLWEVCLAVPALEALLAPSQQFLEALLGGPVTVEQAVRARYEPTVALDELTAERGISRAALFKRLSKMDLAPLRERSPIPELRAFLERSLHPAAS